MANHNAKHLELFEESRAELFGLAYRMLGSVAEAEDVLQDTWIRWSGVDGGSVESPRAFLRRVTTRLCLDVLKSARKRREQYVGPWLPEPLHDQVEFEPGDGLLIQDLTVAFMLALERLSPAERAVFLLHDVFAIPFDEVARILDKSAPACRQLAVRARRRLALKSRTSSADPVQAERLAEAFVAAVRDGDRKGLERLLAKDVQVHTDGGGIRTAALNLIEGRDKAVRLFLGLRRKAGPHDSTQVFRQTFNQMPGFVTVDDDGQIQVTIIEAEAGAITAVYIVRNPRKLSHVPVPADGDTQDLS